MHKYRQIYISPDSVNYSKIHWKQFRTTSFKISKKENNFSLKKKLGINMDYCQPNLVTLFPPVNISSQWNMLIVNLIEHK